MKHKQMPADGRQDHALPLGQRRFRHPNGQFQRQGDFGPVAGLQLRPRPLAVPLSSPLRRGRGWVLELLPVKWHPWLRSAAQAWAAPGRARGLKGFEGPTVRKRTVRGKLSSEKSISRQESPLSANFRLKRHRFDGVFQCTLCFDISDSYFTNVRFRSIGLQTPYLIDR